MTPGTFPASLVATTLVTLDSRYPELAARVGRRRQRLVARQAVPQHAARGHLRVHAPQSAHLPRRRHGRREAGHPLRQPRAPRVLAGGKCACRQCRRLLAAPPSPNRRNTGAPSSRTAGSRAVLPVWERMSARPSGRRAAAPLIFLLRRADDVLARALASAQRAPVPVGRHPSPSALGVLKRLRRGDPTCVFVAFVAFFTWSAFLVASLAVRAEFGSGRLMQSARHPPKTWEEAWRMHGLFKRSIGASLEGSLGLDRGTIFAGGTPRRGGLRALQGRA